MGHNKRFVIDDLRIPAVYFLFRGGEIIYIGQTIDIHGRMTSHKHSASLYYDYFRFIVCPEIKLLEYEARLIAYFRPPFNTSKPKIEKERVKSNLNPKGPKVKFREKIVLFGPEMPDGLLSKMIRESRKVEFYDLLDNWIKTRNR